MYAYFKEIGRNTPIDVTLYNIPMFASPIDVPTVQRLSEECERIVAIKDSSGDIPHMIRMIQAVRPNRPEFSFLTGWDAALMPMLLIGCDGGTNATSGVVPEITRKLYDLTLAGRLDEARELQYELRHAVRRDALLGRVPRGLSGRVSLRGFRTGAGRQPLSAGATRSSWPRSATRCNACWPSTASPTNRSAAARRTPGESIRGRSARSCRACWPSCNAGD